MSLAVDLALTRTVGVMSSVTSEAIVVVTFMTSAIWNQHLESILQPLLRDLIL